MNVIDWALKELKSENDIKNLLLNLTSFEIENLFTKLDHYEEETQQIWINSYQDIFK